MLIRLDRTSYHLFECDAQYIHFISSVDRSSCPFLSYRFICILITSFVMCWGVLAKLYKKNYNFHDRVFIFTVNNCTTINENGCHGDISKGEMSSNVQQQRDCTTYDINISIMYKLFTYTVHWHHNPLYITCPCNTRYTTHTISMVTGMISNVLLLKACKQCTL